MTTRFSPQARHHAAAFVLALASTLVMLSGVDHLAAASPSGALLVQAAPSATQA